MPTVPPGRRKSQRPRAGAAEEAAAEAEVDSERDRTVMRWAAAVDDVDYVTLLQLPLTAKGPSDDDLRRAYRVFARAFHPDHYRGAAAPVRAAAARVFAAGADAHHVLSDPLMKMRYLRTLAAGKPRPKLEDLEREAQSDVRKAAHHTAVELARTEAGKRSAERADHMIAAGELPSARSHLEDAVRKEPDNLPLLAKQHELEAKLFAPRGGAKR